jgi:uncharacterized protein (TIGR03083 family)
MTDVSWLGPPIDVRSLFAKQQAAFIDLLRHLDTEQWAQPTICSGWDVKDIAAHVLGDHIGRLSRHRDGYPPLHPRDNEAFPAFLDRINHEWVTAARRISPQVLIEQLSIIGTQIVEFWQTVDLNALGGRVSWAGPQPAPVWLDAARDFTEYWAHHQQICDATGRTGLTDPRYLGPVLDTFMRALPHTLRNLTAPDGTALQVIVTGPSGGEWSCTRSPDRWSLQRQPHPQPAARLELDADTTWRLCTRGITPERAAEHAHIDGDQHLATAALQIVSIIWTPPNPEAFGEL